MYEKVVRKDKFEVLFVVVQPQSERVLIPFHTHGRNMDSPQHTRDQAAMESVTFMRETAPKKAMIALAANKVITTVSWKARCMIYIDYLR